MAKKGKGFSLKTIPALCIAHVEKGVAALAVVLLLFGAYKAVTHEGAPLTPDQLSQAATSARNHIDEIEVSAQDVIEDTEAEVEVDGVKVVQPPPEEIDRKVVPEDFGDGPSGDGLPLDPEIFKKPTKRTTPAILPIYDLVARPGIGAIMMNEDADAGMPTYAGAEYGYSMESYDDGGMGAGGPGGPEKAGRRWMCITGLIPFKEQLRAYFEVFDSVEHRTQYDMPEYYSFVLERAEADDVDPATGEPNWETIDIGRMVYRDECARWAGKGPMLISGLHRPKMWQPRPRGQTSLGSVRPMPMAMPLPPVVGKDFGTEITHPSIPLLSDAQLEQARTLMDERKRNPRERTISDVFGGAGGGYGEDEYGGGDEMYYAEEGYGAGDYSASMYGGARKPPEIENQLFRFFDFSVEPGKAYVYRVKVMLVNPNFEVPDEYLEDPALALQETLEAEWSDPSEPTAMPLDSRVLVASVKAPTSDPTASPKGNLCCVYFDMDRAMESSYIGENIVRGAVANYSSKPIYVARQRSMMASSEYGAGEYGGDYGEYGEYGGGYGPGMGRPTGPQTGQDVRPDEPVETSLDYITNVCVLDMLGGEKTPGKSDDDMNTPGRMLLMSPTGQLAVQSEFDDVEQYSIYARPDRSRRVPAGIYGGYGGR